MRASLALRALIGTLAGTAYITTDFRLAFWFLVAGAVLDFIIQCLPPDTEIKDGTKVLVVLFLAGAFWLSGCGSVRPVASSVSTDTTITTYKRVDIKVAGAKVVHGINLDSLFAEGRKAREQYVRDSTAAALSGKLLPAPNPQIHTIVDPQSKAQLTYWLDQYGKLQLGCESKDQTIQALVAENNRLRQETKTVTFTEFKTPVWNYILMLMLGAALVLSLFKR